MILELSEIQNFKRNLLKAKIINLRIKYAAIFKNKPKKVPEDISCFGVLMAPSSSDGHPVSECDS